MTGYLPRPLEQFLDEFADAEPVPGGGTAAAVTTAMAAGLLAMVARASRADWPDAAGVAAQAETLRSRVTPLAQADAEAYVAVLRLLEQPRSGDQERRDAELGSAYARSAAVPLRIAQAACDVAELGVLVVERADPRLRADATAAVVLADSAAQICAHLVRINLSTQPDDELVVRANQVADTTARAVRQAIGD